MTLYLIRHGTTKGNLDKRYVGRTDEGLCREGAEEIKKRIADGFYAGVEKTDILFVSPMRRCIDTAGILLPDKQPVIIPSFREIDFGEFEGKNYRELAGNPSYQAWIDSGGQMTFPGGESREAFAARCRDGMGQAVSCVADMVSGAADEIIITMVVHGGTIMSLLSEMGEGNAGYYDYQCENGGGYCCELEAENGQVVLKSPRPL